MAIRRNAASADLEITIKVFSMIVQHFTLKVTKQGWKNDQFVIQIPTETYYIKRSVFVEFCATTK